MTPPNPGKGYRLLKVGEKIQKGDEFRTRPQKVYWLKTAYAGRALSGLLATNYLYRRKLKPKAKHGKH